MNQPPSGKATLQDAVAVKKSLPNTCGFLYGKGQTYKVYRCKHHDRCPSLLRIRPSKVDGKFELAYSDHEHAMVDSIARRGVPVVQDEYRYCMGTALCCTDLYWYSYYFADAVLVGYDTRTYHTVRYRYACVLRCE